MFVFGAPFFCSKAHLFVSRSLNIDFGYVRVTGIRSGQPVSNYVSLARCFFEQYLVVQRLIVCLLSGFFGCKAHLFVSRALNIDFGYERATGVRFGQPVLNYVSLARCFFEQYLVVQRLIVCLLSVFFCSKAHLFVSRSLNIDFGYVRVTGIRSGQPVSNYVSLARCFFEQYLVVQRLIVCFFFVFWPHNSLLVSSHYTNRHSNQPLFRGADNA